MNLKYSLCENWLTKGLLCCTFTFFSSQVRVLQSQITVLFQGNYIEQVPHYPVPNITHVYLPPSFSQECFRPRATPERGGQKDTGEVRERGRRERQRVVCCREKDALVGNTDVFIKRLENQKLSKGTFFFFFFLQRRTDFSMRVRTFFRKEMVYYSKGDIKKRESIKVSKTLLEIGNSSKYVNGVLNTNLTWKVNS